LTGIKKVNISIRTDNKCIKFLGSASRVNSVVPWEQTDGQTEMTQLLPAFHYFANSPKRNSSVKCRIQEITGTVRGFAGVENCPFISYLTVINN
jgi:hypothetical protein